MINGIQTDFPIVACPIHGMEYPESATQMRSDFLVNITQAQSVCSISCEVAMPLRLASSTPAYINLENRKRYSSDSKSRRLPARRFSLPSNSLKHAFAN